MGLSSAKQRDIASLQNWVKGTGCIARAEIAYLAHRIDLVNVSSAKDYALDHLEGLLEATLMRYCKRYRTVSAA